MASILPILDWYQQHKRDLPWRNTHNPYLIWLSEVILQQTRIEQGLPYFERFVSRYPTVTDLSHAPDDEVMKLWQGLGYYNRAKNMLKTARLVTSEWGGNFPNTYNQLIELNGIGPYTAAAIASFAFGEAKAVVDGNVYRVLARVFGISEPINSTSGKKIFAELAQEVIHPKHPDLHNQAMMELGSTVCKPQSPRCDICPLRLQCHAYTTQTVASFPVKIPKQKPKERFLHFFVITDSNHTYIRQRTSERIWHNLFEPPNMETGATFDPETFLTHPDTQQWFDAGKGATLKLAFQTKHQLTHQTIFAHFWLVQPGKKFNPKHLIKVTHDELPNFAVHRLFDKFLNFRTLHP